MMSAAAVLALAIVSGAASDPFPTRFGESGVIDVPTADVLAESTIRIGGEMATDRVPGTRSTFGPLPLFLNVGAGHGFEFGLFARQWAMPGDPRPTSALLGAALKLSLVEASGLVPGLALDVVGDRLNDGGNVSGRLIASTGRLGPVKLAAVGGALARPIRRASPVGGAALDVDVGNGAAIAFDALATPDGPKYGSAVRYAITKAIGVTGGVDYLPRQEGVRFSLGFALLASSPRARRAPVPAEVETPVIAPEPVPETGPEFLDDRPHFRLRIRPSPLGNQPGHTHDRGGAEPVSSAPGSPPAFAGGPVVVEGRR